MEIHVIDNGGQWTHREWRTLKYLGVETEILPNTTPFKEIDKVDGVVLSGGSPRIGLEKELGKCGEYLNKATMPIMGICAGHQFMARHFGGECSPSIIPEFGKVEIVIDKTNEIFKGIQKKSVAWESHNDEVTRLPDDFIVLAHSKYCKVQAMKHPEKPFYGLQFHPEVEHTEYGKKIFENFIQICRSYG